MFRRLRHATRVGAALLLTDAGYEQGGTNDGAEGEWVLRRHDTTQQRPRAADAHAAWWVRFAAWLPRPPDWTRDPRDPWVGVRR